MRPAAAPFALPGIGAVQRQDAVVVRGAREHNLQGVDVEIPRGRLVVVTGPSGSGKSSLAFDTIYAEGQRRYLESLSAYARQFLEQLRKPDVDEIEGLSPSLAIEQKSIGRSPRSTVGTATEVADYLRLLFARAGTPHCPSCGQAISSQGLGTMTERVMGLGEGARLQVMAPVVRGRKGAYKKELDTFRRKGYVRVRIDGVMHDLADDIKINRQARHDIDLVIDRIVVREKSEARVRASIETALSLGDGLVKIDLVDRGEEWLLSSDNACLDCNVSMPEISPRLFSFNNPTGACEACSGLGERRAFDPELVVPDPSLPLISAIEPWQRKKNARYYAQLVRDLAEHFGVDEQTPFGELPKKVQRALLFGTREEVAFSVGLRPTRGGKARKTKAGRPFAGVLDELQRRGDARLERFQKALPCSECGGTRLRAISRSVTVGGRGIHALSAMSIADLDAFLCDYEPGEAAQREVAARVVKEIRERLGFLCDVGLGYLSLDRPSATLSGGEAQRIRLATQIGASMMGVLYILDEPSIGLHPRDNDRLLDALTRLRNAGNSLIVVEHDEATIRAADHVIDMGPGAGIHGGRVVAEGHPAALARAEHSPTGDYLAGRKAIPIPHARRPGSGQRLELLGARANNLQNVDLAIPAGAFTVVTGVSGSGKSTLIGDTLHPAMAALLHGAERRPGAFDALRGADQFEKVIDVDQAPIGRSPRSNPATYSGAFGGIRLAFSQVTESRVRGYESGRFSFNTRGGRCEDCEGDGQIRVEMHFLPDHFVPCASCRGRRYSRETLEIEYRGRNIADVLEMTVEEALGFMENVPSVRRPLQALHDVGLDYIRLGQSATTLSGGEAQRIKLAKELARRSSGRTLYILDEPTTGLHFADVEKLLELLHRLVDLGNTVLVIEHHLDVVANADHVVDLGPEGGAGGGRIVATGTPERVAGNGESHTGRALRALLQARGIPIESGGTP